MVQELVYAQVMALFVVGLMLLVSCAVMVPMAIPSFGGMAIAIITLLVVPVLYCWIAEFRLKFGYSSPT